MRHAVLLLIPGIVFAADDTTERATAILKKNCLACHGAAMQSSGLDLRSQEAMRKGGTRGPALVPGKPDQSKIIRFVTGAEQPAMPPGKKLADADIDVLKKWIEAGGEFQTVQSSEADKKSALARMEERPITAEERQFWSFRPVSRTEPPALAGHDNPVDRFLAQAWQAKGLKPSPPADRRTLARRLYLDVIGIPPTPDEVATFVADTSPSAYSNLVDKLLASPHYGERWGRHWLDLVRYADSAGYEFDRDRNNSWRFRDWVVDALNADMPYDRFLKMQIAGDEYEPGSVEGLIATGYLRLGPEANIKTETTRIDELDDIIATTGGTMLGMTIGCARCHNHKFDPIPQKDYYRMQAVFFPATAASIPIVPKDEQERHKAAHKAWEGQIQPVQKQLAEIEKPYRERIRKEKIAQLPDYMQLAIQTPADKRTEGQKLNAIQIEKTLLVSRGEVEAILSPDHAAQACKLREQITLLDLEEPKIETALTIAERMGPRAPESHFLHHGSVDNKGSVMPPGVLSVAASVEPPFPKPDPGAQSSLRRKGFAEWIASSSNPLTARVMVNRLWMHHFGEGLVRTPSNFGKTGDRPTHPELLDWLASEFVKSGWSMKAMHRLMLTSSAYQMASDDIPANSKLDGENRLVWRMPRRRMEGEILRDSVLAVSGKLDPKLGGPGFYPYIDPALFASSSGRSWPGKPDSDPSTFRRSIYIFVKRTIPVPMMEVFDSPNTNLACPRRNRSTVAPQALILMNSSFALQHAEYFADRLKREAGNDLRARIERAYEIALSRKPTEAERKLASEFLDKDPGALADFCQTIFNLNEFAYLP